MKTKTSRLRSHRRPAKAPTELMTHLNTLSVIEALSWREIAALGDFVGIPAGTLNSIAKTGIVPGVWRERLCPYQPTPRIAIHKTDMARAARTITRNFPPEKVAELADLLTAGQIK